MAWTVVRDRRQWQDYAGVFRTIQTLKNASPISVQLLRLFRSVRAVGEERLIAVTEQEKFVVRNKDIQFGLLCRKSHEKDPPAAVAPSRLERLVIEKQRRRIRI